jgi:hypothetical protein
MVNVLQYSGGRIVPVEFDAGDGMEWRTREEYLEALERDRRRAVGLRRAYYDGRQYDSRNAMCRQEMLTNTEASWEEKAVARAMALWDDKLPEHLRLHEYSTQIAESVDFVANRLADTARIEVEASAAAAVVNAALDASPELAGSPDDDVVVLVNVFREAVKVGDTVVLVRWNPAKTTCWVEFWDSEMVELRFGEDNDTITRAVVEQVDWRVPPGSETGVEEPCQLRRVWEVVPRETVGDIPLDLLDSLLTLGAIDEMPAGALGVRMECVERVYLVKADTDELLETMWWGVPFLPWWPIRGDRKSLRANRGESLISNQTMKTADRYNAVQQHAWLIARYNSHANVVLIGDAVMIEKQNKTVKKDVADVMVFPGATDAKVIQLPTDPQMIKQQEETLKDGLYGSMGITRVDQGSLEGLGGVTGYALEILDQKSEGTFNRIRQQIARDMKRLVNLILDCYAYWSAAQSAAAEDDVTALRPAPYLQIDPQSVFPDRGMEIRLGSGHVVDAARIRDDYVSKLISLEEALRQRGYDDDQIKVIVRELQEAQERAAEAQREAFGQTGTEGTRRPPTTSTQAGRRLNSTDRPDPQDADDDRASA